MGSVRVAAMGSLGKIPITVEKKFVATQQLQYTYHSKDTIVEISTAGFENSKKIPILFNPSQPEEFVVNTPRMLWTWPALLIFVGSILLFLIQRLEQQEKI